MNFPGKFGSSLSEITPVALDKGAVSFDRKADGGDGYAITIPDAHLLFSGDFKREGFDLVLSDQHQRYVVHDYFRGDKHPALISRDGASLSAAVVDALTGYTVYAQAAPAADSGGQIIIGRVLKVSGSASVVRNGVTVELGVGDQVRKGDVVQTGSDSSVGITFIDGSAFGMTSNARMVLNEMVFDPNGSSNSSLISLVQGTVTFVAGQTAKNGNMRVETPVATMGIRGTAVLVEIGANDGPTKFSVLVEPDGTTGSYNLYDNNTGQLIGTVSRAGQVTFVSPNGTNQVSAVEQLKTLADQQQEKAIVQQVFQLYFPGYIPDQDTKPNSNKSGSNTSGNNLAEIHLTTPTGGTPNALLTIELKFAKTDPLTGQTTYTTKTYFNSRATFSTEDTTGGQNILAPANGFSIGDLVKIVDIDIGTAPFFDVATPFIPGTAAFTSAISSIPLPAGFDLYGLVSVDQATGRVDYNAPRFNFLNAGETIVYKIEFDSSSGPDRVHLSLKFTVTGANDAPVFDVSPVTVALAEIGGQTSHAAQTGQSDIISTAVVIGFSDADFTDIGPNYQVVVTNVTSSGSTAGLPQNDPAHPTALKDALLSYFNFSTTPVTKLLDTTTGHVDGTFSATDKTFDYLAAGQQLVLTYTIQITDPENASAVLTKDFTVAVTGSNDAPMLAVDTVSSHQALEKTNTTNAASTVVDTTSGTLAFTDADLTDTHQASVALHTGATAVVWSGGASTAIPSTTLAALAGGMSVSIAADSNVGTAAGSLAWNFSLPDNLFDFLGHSETLTVIYDVTVTDYNNGVATGTSSTQQVAVQITASNDRPVITVVNVTGAVIEDAAVVAGLITSTGSVTFADADATDHETATVAFIGDTTTSGAAIPPGLHTALTGALSLASSSYNSNTGTIGWTFSLGNSLVQYLAAGEQVTATYTITVKDNSGVGANDTSTPQTVTVTITGTNDAPVITADTSGIAGTNVHGVNETDTTLVTSGTLAVGDVDVTNTVAVSVLSVAKGGTGPASALNALDLNALKAMMSVDAGTVIDNVSTTGTIHWSFNSGAQAFDFLAAGETLVLTYIIRATDSDASHATGDQTVVITITGTNDAPIVATTNVTGAVTELTTTPTGNLTGTGTIAFTDVDLTDTHTINAAITASAGALGALTASVSTDTVNGLGGVITWNYSVADAAVEYLAAGQLKVESFTITLNDGHGGTIARTIDVTITGTNDAPIVATTNVTGAVTELTTTPTGNLTGTGTIAFTDVDLTDTHTINAAITASAGALGALTASVSTDTVNGLGGVITWNYSVADAAVEYLAAGQLKVESFTITLNDGHGGTIARTIDVTITGTNDAPIVATTNVTGAVTELTTTPTGNLTGTGTIAFTDVDLTDTHTINAAITASAGALGALTASVSTDTTAGLGGVITWNYSVADAAVEYLAAGQLKVESFTITLNDGHGGTIARTIDVTITGTNDAPSITSNAAVATKSFSELASTTASAASDQVGGTITFADVDLTDTHTVAQTAATFIWSGGMLSTTQVNALMAATTATLVMHDSTGTGAGSVDWTYAITDGALDFLRAGETLSVSYDVTVTDNSGAANTVATQPVSVTFNGSNDAPAVSAISNVALNEQTTTSTLHQAITASFTDVDLTDTGQIASVQKVVATAGTVPPGVTLNADLTGGTLFALLSAGTVTKASGSALGSAAFSFDAASTVFDYLAAGESVTLTYTVAVTDALGAQGTNTVAVTIAGTNDAPVVTTTGGTVTELSGTANTGNDTTSGTISFTDVDLSDLPVVTAAFSGFDYKDASGTHYTSLASLTSAQQAAVLAVESTLPLTPAGGNTHDGSVAWSYTVADNKLDFLAAGETLTLSYNASVDDGHTTIVKPLTVTITGTNDAPVIDVHATSAVAYIENDAAKIVASALTLSDVDSPNMTAATVTISGNYHAGQDVLAFTPQTGITGSFDPANGTLTLTGSASVANYQAALRSVTYFNSSDDPSAATRTISFQTDDGSAANHASNVSTATVAVTPVNDAPTFSGNAIGGAGSGYTENGAPVGIVAVTPLIVGDLDNANFNGGYISAAITAGGHAGDTLSVGTTDHIKIDTDGVTVLSDADGSGPAFSFVTIGTLTASGSSLSIALNSAADAAATMELTSAIRFSSTSDNPTADQRTVTFTLNDGGGTTNGGQAITSFSVPLAVTPVNDAPVIDVHATSAVAYIENDAAKIVASALTLLDVDSPNMTGATVTISGNYHAGQDVLAFINQSGITGAYDFANGILTLTGSASVANYQAALRSVTYFNSSDDPSAATRTISFQTDDGSAASHASNISTATVAVTPVNDAPTITAGAPDHHLVEGTSSVAGTASASALLALADVDGTASYDTAALATGGWIDIHNGTYTKAGTYGSATLDTALNKVLYTLDNNASATNSLTALDHPTETFSVPVTDGLLTASANVVFTIDGSNDAAVIGDPSVASVREGDVDSAGNLTASGAIPISDVDSAATFQTGVASASGNLGTLSLAANGQYTYTVSNTDAGVQALDGATSHVDTFTLTAQDGTTKDVNFTIEGANQNVSTSADEIFTATAGRDNFVFNAGFGHDSISGFTPGSDAIFFDHTVFANVADVISAITSTASDPDTVIAHDPANTLTLTGVTLAQIQTHQSDFHFV